MTKRSRIGAVRLHLVDNGLNFEDGGAVDAVLHELTGGEEGFAHLSDVEDDITKGGGVGGGKY